MKFLKISSILFLSLFMICAIVPQVSAKHHRCKSRTSFGLGFNVAPAPSYVVAPAPVPVAVVPCRTCAPVYPYPYYVSAPVVAAPVYSPYIQPGFSFSYWRY